MEIRKEEEELIMEGSIPESEFNGIGMQRPFAPHNRQPFSLEHTGVSEHRKHYISIYDQPMYGYNPMSMTGNQPARGGLVANTSMGPGEYEGDIERNETRYLSPRAYQALSGHQVIILVEKLTIDVLFLIQECVLASRIHVVIGREHCEAFMTTILPQNYVIVLGEEEFYNTLKERINVDGNYTAIGIHRKSVPEVEKEAEMKRLDVVEILLGQDERPIELTGTRRGAMVRFANGYRYTELKRLPHLFLQALESFVPSTNGPSAKSGWELPGGKTILETAIEKYIEFNRTGDKNLADKQSKHKRTGEG